MYVKDKAQGAFTQSKTYLARSARKTAWLFGQAVMYGAMFLAFSAAFAAIAKVAFIRFVLMDWGELDAASAIQFYDLIGAYIVNLLSLGMAIVVTILIGKAIRSHERQRREGADESG